MMRKFLYGVCTVAISATLVACSRTESALVEENTVPQVDVKPTPTSTHKQTLIQRQPATPAQPLSQATSVQPPSKSRSAPQASPKPVFKSKPIAAPILVNRTPFRVKKCMNMGNALEAPHEGDWGYRISKADLRIVAQAGFDTIRLPVRWDTHAAHRPPYAIDAGFMARVKTVVRDAQTLGLGVIIDVHHYEDLMTQPVRQTPRFLSIWDQIARAFKDASDSVYFEALNEPTRDLSQAQVNDLYAKLLPIIRATNPTRPVILGGNSWNSIETMSEVNWPKGGNLVATFHDYGPHEFTHQGAEWSEPIMPLGRVWGGKADNAEFAETYKLVREFKAKTGLPVFVGEFGVIDKVPLDQRNQWIKARRKAMEAHGISWCAWDFSGAFKTYDVQRKTWLPGTQDALFGQ